jgi:MFS family permease
MDDVAGGHPGRVSAVGEGAQPALDAEPTSIFSAALRPTTLGILVLITLIAFESMAVSAALPTAAREVHGLAAYGWAFTAFLIANVVGMVAAGQLSGRSGPRVPLVAGLACFTGGLLLSGTATTWTQLVGGRVVQGLGGGLLITAIYVVMGEAYAARLRPPLFAATSSAWVVPSLVGPPVSGLLTQHASWRWVFLGLVPFVLVGAALILPVLRRLRPPQTGRPASLLQLLRALGVAFGIAGLEQAGQHPSLLSIPLGVLAAVALVWGLAGLLPPGTVRIAPGVSAPIAMRGLLAGSFFGVESLVPLSLTVQHGYSPTAAGLPLALSGASWAIGSWWQGRADDSAGPHVRVALIRTGFGLMTVAAVGMALAAVPALPGWIAYPAWLVAGLGAGLTMSSVGVLVLNFTTDADRGADSAALQLSDATVSALTTGAGGVLVAAAARQAITFTTAVVGLDIALAVLALLGAVSAGRARPATAKLALTG